jgi:predicted CXXCH cytochrome family protein
MVRALIAALLLGVSIAGAHVPAAFAQSQTGAQNDLVPHPPKGRGEHCVADTAFMRRYHMTMLKHQRDETVHEGVRGKSFSIGGCVSCHAVNGADGLPVSYEDPKHFCRSCHEYAAVSIDCFECHASRPGPKPQDASAESGAPGSTALANYLQESHP